MLSKGASLWESIGYDQEKIDTGGKTLLRESCRRRMAWKFKDMQGNVWDSLIFKIDFGVL